MSDTIKPIGTIKVMGEWEENGIITVDVNDDVYKDDDELFLQTSFPANNLISNDHDDEGWRYPDLTVEQFIERNRNNLTWTIAHA